EDARVPEPTPVPGLGEGGEGEGGREDHVGVLGEEPEAGGYPETEVCAEAVLVAETEESVEGGGARREDGGAVGQGIVKSPAHGEHEEQGAGREGGQPRGGEEPPRACIDERVRDAEERVLHDREAQDAHAEEAERGPDEPVVERWLARLIAPGEGLAEDRLA